MGERKILEKKTKERESEYLCFGGLVEMRKEIERDRERD